MNVKKRKHFNKINDMAVEKKIIFHDDKRNFLNLQKK